MLTTGDALAKTLAKSQKVTFWSKKNSFRYFFFLLTIGDVLTNQMSYIILYYVQTYIRGL